MSALDLVDFGHSPAPIAQKDEVRELLARVDREEAEHIEASKRERAALLRHYDLEILPPPAKLDAPTISPIGDIPDASHLCTDQMNAKRLEAWYGKKLVACDGDFYGYDGTKWVRDCAFAARCAATLTQIVQAEANGARKTFESLAHGNALVGAVLSTKRRDQSQAADSLRASPNGAKILESLTKAEALEKWARACESATIQQKALRLLRDMHTVDASIFNRDPMLLNCANGTVNLRTGKLRPHDPLDFCTKLAPVNYDWNAKAPRWEQFLSEIQDDVVVAFMQRWYGYCATGDVSEQCMLVKIGEGRNGKSTEVDVIAEVLGEYADTAATGLLTATSDRHPTEVAALLGVRLVTTHESDESAVLREGLLKQLTGGDKINARYLYKNAFTFTPTCKFQLLSNHRPVVRGADDGIWRRLRLVWYRHRFGTPEEVAAGKATRVREKDLKEKLLAERDGILTWIVRGSVDWSSGGLREPPSVLAASESYRREQNRVGKWIEECCSLDQGSWSPYSGVPDGLYQSYTLWCKLSGHQPLSKINFIDRLQQEVPNFRPHERKAEINGVRRTVRGCYGLRVLIAELSFGPVVMNADLIHGMS